MSTHAPHSAFLDLDGYIALPRLTGLSLSPGGQRLIASVSQIDAERTAYATSLWSIDIEGKRPARRLTRGVKGEALAAHAGDALLFTAKRDVPAESAEKPSETTSAIWCLPAHGEAFPVLSRDGGHALVRTARSSDVVLLGATMFDGVADDEADAKLRAERKQKKVNAILHTTAVVRYWDHDLGAEHTRLRIGRLDGDRIVDVQELTGDVGHAIADAQLSPDGHLVAAEWQVRHARGREQDELVLIDVGTRERRTLAADPHRSYAQPIFSPDSSRLVVVEYDDATPEACPDQRLLLFDLTTGERRVLTAGWDRWATPAVFSPDGATLYVTADDGGHRPIFAIDLATDEVTRLTEAGAFSQVQVAPDGATLYALRSAYDQPGEVVAIDVADRSVRTLPSVEYPDLPGRLERVETLAHDGTRIPGWLVLPDGASPERPAPLTLWVHGGPVSSWNDWSWRWCPWLLASRGQAVLLPDPALSTGYGRDFVQRGWSRWGAEPYTDVMALTDAIEARDDIRDDASTMMGGSFGGYMANWIATQTDRFKAIVTHASLWDLRAFSGTTDFPAFWRDGFTPEIFTEHNPANFADQIRTPMLVIHGDKDYRVPIGEGLALWWALTGSHDGDPTDIPHRFLYFPDENHWILTPQHAKIWYETIIEFLDAHRSGRMPERPGLL